MSEIIRLVVCQLECHPAFYRDRLACLEEPFMPESYKVSLSQLGSLGIPITEMQEFFKEEYLKWHKKRLQELLKHSLLNEYGEKLQCLGVASTLFTGVIHKKLALSGE